VTIKSHHNVGGLPERMKMQLVEPLRELFKDEVRELGVALGLPHDMVYRHPFPGPGLGVRILGEVKKDYADLLRRADAIFIEELRNFKDESTGKITNWRWDFGDGTTSTDQHPIHTYQKAGQYVVSLNIEGPAGKSRMSKVWDVTVR